MKQHNNHCEVSVIGPAMNEAGTLEEYVERCLTAFRNENITGEIIIIDDGSDDSTSIVLRNLIKKFPNFVKGFKHRKNLGLTRALKTGFAQAKGKFILWIPTDLESYPDIDIPILLQGFKEGADVVAGYRQGRNDGKKFASRVYNFVCNKLFGLNLKDMNWLKGFRHECIDFMQLRGDWHRFIVVMLHNAGFKIIEKEMQWHPRKYGESKFGFMRFPHSFIDAISIWFLLLFSKKPMRLFGSIGVLLLSLGVLSHIFSIILYLYAKTQIRPLFWSALTAELMGIQFILFGLVTELIERNRSELISLKQFLGKSDGKAIRLEINDKETQ